MTCTFVGVAFILFRFISCFTYTPYSVCLKIKKVHGYLAQSTLMRLNCVYPWHHEHDKMYQAPSLNMCMESLETKIMYDHNSTNFVARWAKTQHIPHFMKIPEICISMCNYSAVKNGSDRLLGSWVAERKASQTWNATFWEKHNVFMLLRTLSCYVKLTCVLVKRQLESRQRQLGKTAVVKVGAYIVSIDRKTTVYWLEAGEIASFENACL